MPSRFQRALSTGLLLFGLPFALAGCGGGMIGDILPQAVGGYPKDAPPRPGTPGYEEWLAKVYGHAPKEPAKVGEKSAKQQANEPMPGR